MKRKEQYADEIIEMLERTKCGAWASNINLNTKDRVIEVCQNVVDSWSGRKFKDHCTTSPQALEQTGWIPVSERLPETDGRFLTYIENPYDSQLSYMMVCDYISQTWCPDDETASDNVIAWMTLPEPYVPDTNDGKMGESEGCGMTFAQERDKAFIDAVVNDDWTGVKKYCKKYGVPVPKNEKVMKAGVYKAVQECTNIPNDVKETAAWKCLYLGFFPYIKDVRWQDGSVKNDNGRKHKSDTRS